MVRVIRAYSKKTELHAYDIQLPDIELSKLQALFSIPSDDPMYDCYEINSSAYVSFFNCYISDRLDFEKYDFFMEND